MEARYTGETEIFAQRVRELRKRRRGLSCVALSELCGLHSDAVRRYERGEAKPSLEAAVAIADYFGVSVDYLTGRDETQRR
jgi:transcriptional regulator with XRE-family HTH domain